MSSKTDEPTPVFKRCFVLCNPASTNAASVKKRIVNLELALQVISPGVILEVIEMQPRERQSCAQILALLKDTLDSHTLLGIGAGDGTVNSVIETLLKAKTLPPKARKAVILPLWGGNANDLAHMLNGPAYRANFEHILQQGKVSAIHPLQCQLSIPGGERKLYYASNYASFGATAFAAQKLNEPEHRRSLLSKVPGGRALQELLTVFSALVEAPAFTVVENGRPSIIYERTFANGNRMGKLSRLPVKLTDQGFYSASLRDKKILSLLPQVFDVIWEVTAKRWLKYSHASFTVTEDAYAQFDGEAVKVPAGTKVTVQLSERPFYALSTLLK